ncbi:SUKH-4 family immunity protein [Streptomyces justiciae]|uniref:SUKH-4 family immunity protein n=1 Tax=Streptomyces justiciae TaxID=2780140 RepID=A0ABU3LW99_9ACTN|nr:SUKH-4 family immunity protein [Streptomyces justiciae]MDT7842838.1 SUKH-4 family immunity protein [Streptomyces justiciae]
MSTTGTAPAVITLTDDDLERLVTHASTRSWLTGPGLPTEIGLLSFAELGREGLRTLTDATGDPEGRLAVDMRDQLVIGGLLDDEGRETESVLLDGVTGEVSTTEFWWDRPDLMERRPLAPSLEKLVRFATATEELTELRGQFAAYADRHGPQVAAEVSRQLLAIFEEGTDGEVPGLWRAAALIRPLSLTAGPGRASGLALDLPSRLLDQEFGQGEIWRFEEVDFPVTLTHEPTRRFLRDAGLPEDTVLFRLDTDVPLPTLTEHYADDLAAELPADADHLIRLGYLVEDSSLVVDGRTGAVLHWSESEALLHPLNTDVSTLAFTLWLLSREATLDEELSQGRNRVLGEPLGPHAQLAATMIQVLSTVDRTGSAPGADWHYWTEALRDEAGGAL